MTRTGGDLLAADVHKKLRTRILTLEIKPRTRLVEEEISTELGVGRTPVREALLRLQGEGLVSRNKGWIVEEGDPSKVHWIFESRLAIEGFATRLASGLISDQVIGQLTEMTVRMDDLDNISRVELNRLNRHFHEAIVRAAENPFFTEMHERTQFNYWNLRLPVLFTREQVVHANEQHKAIVAALSERNGDLAEQRARDHIQTTFEIVQSAMSGF